MIRVGVIGASGYGGGEMIRLLSRHPEVKLEYLSSESFKGKDIASSLPNMRGFLEARFEPYDPAAIRGRCDFIFFAQHNGWAMKEARGFLEAGLKVIDLSADFRFDDASVYEQWYGIPHDSPDLTASAVYGLPELYRDEISGSDLVANPGCYPTSAVLALAPLLENKLVSLSSIIVDSKSGVSGAGRSKFSIDYHFPELNQSMGAYNIGVHRHTPEIEQELGQCAGVPVTIQFTPHLIPVTRGILTTAYASLLVSSRGTEDIVDMYRDFYQSDYFVVILDPGEYPSTKPTLTSNFCHIGLKVDERTNRVIVVSALDNLGKGMAGQAVQNMNIMCGFHEWTALDAPGILP